MKKSISLDYGTVKTYQVSAYILTKPASSDYNNLGLPKFYIQTYEK